MDVVGFPLSALATGRDLWRFMIYGDTLPNSFTLLMFVSLIGILSRKYKYRELHSGYAEHDGISNLGRAQVCLLQHLPIYFYFDGATIGVVLL